MLSNLSLLLLNAHSTRAITQESNAQVASSSDSKISHSPATGASAFPRAECISSKPTQSFRNKAAAGIVSVLCTARGSTWQVHLHVQQYDAASPRTQKGPSESRDSGGPGSLALPRPTTLRTENEFLPLLSYPRGRGGRFSDRSSRRRSPNTGIPLPPRHCCDSSETTARQAATFFRGSSSGNLE